MGDFVRVRCIECGRELDVDDPEDPESNPSLPIHTRADREDEFPCPGSEGVPVERS